MPDDPVDTQAQRIPGGKPESDGLTNASQDAADGAVKPQDGPMDRLGTEAEGLGDEPMTNEPIPTTDDSAGVGLTEKSEPEIEGSRWM